MKKIIFVFLLFLTSCGYQPLYSGKNTSDFLFNKILLEGNKNINRKIISTLSFKEVPDNFDYDELIIISNKKIVETSKNSKGQVNSYRTEINVEFKIVNNNEIMRQKNFSKDFSYNNLDNKFDLTSYQDEVENNLVNKIIEELIIFINL
jgi:hypothetical protein|tara:strand:+ start:129 stop:575 length:447 start_codon:yes stop_codon:yes gene_type:complete